MRILMAAMTVLGAAAPEVKPTKDKNIVPANEKGNLIQILSADKDLSSFLQLIDASGWTYRVATDGPYLLLAPSDEAFDELDPREFNKLALPENFNLLLRLVTSHILTGDRLPKEGETLQLKSLSGKNVTMSMKDGSLYIDNLKALVAPTPSSNGWVIKIDEVLNF